MIESAHILMVIGLLASLHIYFNIPNKKGEDLFLALIIGAYLIHNTLHPFISLVFGREYLYIEYLLPINLLYPPSLYLYNQVAKKNKLFVKNIIPHYIPFILLFISYLFVIFNNSIRDQYMLLYVKIIYSLTAISSIVYSSYLLFISKHTTNDTIFFSWYLLTAGLMLSVISYNLIFFENFDFSKVNTNKEVMPMTILIISFMSLGVIFVYIWSINRFKQNILYNHEDNRISLKQLFIRNCKNKKQSNNQNDESIDKTNLIEEYFDAQLKSNSDINLKDLATHLNTTQYQTKEIILEKYGVGFSKLTTKFRINYACEILNDLDSEIKTYEDIAKECGFGSVASFYRNFKLNIGMTPNEYKNRSILIHNTKNK